MHGMHAADMSIERAIRSDPDPGKHLKHWSLLTESTSLLDIHFQLLFFSNMNLSCWEIRNRISRHLDLQILDLLGWEGHYPNNKL